MDGWAERDKGCKGMMNGRKNMKDWGKGYEG